MRRSATQRSAGPAEVPDPAAIRRETEALKHAAGMRVAMFAWPSILEKGFDASWASVAEGMAVAAVQLVSSREPTLRALGDASYAYGLVKTASAFGSSPLVVSGLMPLVRAASSETDEHRVASTASVLACVVGGCCWVFLPKLAAFLATRRHPTIARASHSEEASDQKPRPASLRHRAPRPQAPRAPNPTSSADLPEPRGTLFPERALSPDRTRAPRSTVDATEADAAMLGDAPGPSGPASIQGEAVVDGGSSSNTLDALDRLLASIPQRAIALGDLRACLARRHRTTDMIRLLRLRLEGVPEDRDARCALAEALTLAGQYAAALDELESLIAAMPEDLSNPLAALKVQAAQLDAVERPAPGRSARMAAIVFAGAAGDQAIAPDTYEEARRSLWSMLNFEAPAPETARTRDIEALREAFTLRVASGFKPAPARAISPERKRGIARFTTTAADGTHRTTTAKYVGIGARDTYVYEEPKSQVRYWVQNPTVIEKDGGPRARLPHENRWVLCDPVLEKRFNDLAHAGFLDGSSLSDLATSFARSGYSLFLAGGCVRRLVRKEPVVSTDVDLVGTAPLLHMEAPLGRICAAHPECSLTVHHRLGALTLQVKTGSGTLTGLDYVVMRAGGAYENVRALHGAGFEGSPLVLGPDPVYHARSLDFTINTLLYDLVGKEIWDPTGKGMFDAQKGVLRLPSMAFVESNDKLFVRALKFLIADPELQIDPATLSGLQRNASRFESKFVPRLRGIMPKFESIEASTSWRDALVEAMTRLGRDAQVAQVPEPVELYARARSQD